MSKLVNANGLEELRVESLIDQFVLGLYRFQLKLKSKVYQQIKPNRKKVPNHIHVSLKISNGRIQAESYMVN